MDPQAEPMEPNIKVEDFEWRNRPDKVTASPKITPLIPPAPPPPLCISSQRVCPPMPGGSSLRIHENSRTVPPTPNTCPTTLAANPSLYTLGLPSRGACHASRDRCCPEARHRHTEMCGAEWCVAPRRGSHAKVKLGREKKTGEMVAIKVMEKKSSKFEYDTLCREIKVGFSVEGVRGFGWRVEGLRGAGSWGGSGFQCGGKGPRGLGWRVEGVRVEVSQAVPLGRRASPPAWRRPRLVAHGHAAAP